MGIWVSEDYRHSFLKALDYSVLTYSSYIIIHTLIEWQQTTKLFPLISGKSPGGSCVLDSILLESVVRAFNTSISAFDAI